MRRRGSFRRPAVFVLLAAVLAVFTVPGLALAERYELEGTRVAIYNLAGEIDVVRGSGSSVVVEVTRGGKDGDELDVATGEIDGKMTLRVLYPENRIRYGKGSWLGGGSSATLRVGPDGRFSDGSTRNGRGERVRISSSGSGLEAHADLRIHVPPGKQCGVYLAVGSMTASGVESDLSLDAASADIRSTDTKGDLLIDTGSGSVEVTGARGSVNVDTGSGSVELANIDGDHVVVDTGSGSVSGSAIRARDFSVDTGSGGVEVSRLSAEDISIDTGSGGVDLELTANIHSLSVDTGSGSVTVRVPETLGAHVYLETGSGGVRTNLPMDVMRKNRDSVRGVIGDGKGRIEIETGSGSVRLLKG